MLVRLIVGRAPASPPELSAPVDALNVVFPHPTRSIGGRISHPLEATRAATQRLASR